MDCIKKVTFRDYLRLTIFGNSYLIVFGYFYLIINKNISDYINCKQVYNVTSDGKIVKFQPDNSPENGYHSYEVSSPRDIPNDVRKEMGNDGKLSKVQVK